MDDTGKASTGATDANFGNAETIPAEAKYIVNFDGEEINGRRYKLGDTVRDDVDAGTIRYLVQTGRISEQGKGDSSAGALGGQTSAVPVQTATPVASMDRAALLNELGGGMSDDDLRGMVEWRREAGAAERDADAADADDGEGDEGDREPAPELSAEEAEARDRLVADNNKDALLKLAKDESVEGVTSDNNKGEIATKIVVARRAG